MRQIIIIVLFVAAAAPLSAQFSGIGTVSPTNALHVKPLAGQDPIRVEDLRPATSTDTEAVVFDPATGIFRRKALNTIGSDDQQLTYNSINNELTLEDGGTAISLAGLKDNLGNHTATQALTMSVHDANFTSGGLNLATGTASFGSTTRQMLNLWGTEYGIGVQNNTQYYRSDDHFVWFRRGTHSGTQFDAGTGGTAMMALTSAGRLGIGTTAPSARLTVEQIVPTSTDESLVELYTRGGGVGHGSSIAFRNDGAGYLAAIAGIDDGTNDGRIEFRTSNNNAINTGPIPANGTKVVITKAGNVGIGTGTASAHPLHLGSDRDVTSAGLGALVIGSTTNQSLHLDNNEIQAVAAGSAANGLLYLQRDGGRVMIGGSPNTPSANLDVSGSVRLRSLATDTQGTVVGIDADGNLSRRSTAAFADNLGNHTATTNVRLNNNWLSGDGDSEGIRVGTTGNVGVGVAAGTGTDRVTVAGGHVRTTAGSFIVNGYGNGIGFNGESVGDLTPIEDGGRIYVQSGGFSADPFEDFLLIEKTDRNQTEVDGGIAFALRGSSGARTIPMAIRGDNNVGIGTLAPTNTLDINGTARVRTLGAGAAGDDVVTVDANGVLRRRSTLSAGDNLGNHTATQALGMGTFDANFSSGGLNLATGAASFGATTRQMVNLWNASYGIGVQGGTQYFRSDNHFAWYRGGTHDNGILNPGGGTAMMALTSAGRLGIGTTTPSATLDVVGSARVQTLPAGAGADDVVTVDADGNLRRRSTLSAGDNLGNHTATQDVNFGSFSAGMPAGRVNFGNSMRQMLNLWDTSFGIGIQGATQYYRSGANFAWYRGGTHDDGILNPGGGTAMMALTSAGRLGIGTTTPSATLDVVGSARVQTLPAGANADDVVTVDASGNLRRRPTLSAGDNLGNHTATQDVNFGSFSAGMPAGRVNFGNSMRQMLNLWDTSFGIGIQGATQYYRSGANFAWYRGGTHDDGILNPGGGTAMMALTSAGRLGIGTTAPSATLDVVGSARVQTLPAGAGADDVVTVDADGNLRRRSTLSAGDNLGNHTATQALAMGVHDANFTTGTANFGTNKRQMLNLWGTEYGVGIQDFTLYQRSNSGFAWYRGGGHNDGIFNAGGGTQAMRLDNTSTLYVAGDIGSGSRYLGQGNKEAIRTNDAWLRLNQNNDFANGIYTPGNFRVDGSVVFNENAANSDFRVEGQGDQHLLYTRANQNRVGIGTANPAVKLHVLSLADVTNTGGGILNLGTSSDFMAFDANEIGAFSSGAPSALHLQAEGDQLIIGQNSPSTSSVLAWGRMRVVNLPNGAAGDDILTVDGSGNFRRRATPSSAGDNLGDHTATLPLSMVDQTINFNFTLGQKINLYQDLYGIGMQASTQYFRSQGHFAWYQDGAHNAGELNPGGGVANMVLKSGALLGIGTNDPTERLDVNGRARIRSLPGGASTDEVVTIDPDGRLRKVSRSTVGDNLGDHTATLPLAMGSNNINFGNSTGQKLNLFGAAFGSGVQAATHYFRTSNQFAWYKNGSHNDGAFNPGGGATMMTLDDANRLHVNGTITATGAITSTSDSTLKHRVVTVSDALAKVMRMKGVYYDWLPSANPDRTFTTDRQVGFLAQAVERVLPEAVHTGADGIKGVDYGKITPVLVNAMQEQQAQIEQLRRDNEELRKMVLDMAKQMKGR